MRFLCKKCLNEGTETELIVVEQVTNNYDIDPETGKAANVTGGEQGDVSVWCCRGHENDETGYTVGEWSPEEGVAVTISPIE